IVASGITPNGMAVFFGIMRGRTGFKATMIRVERVVADADGDGVVALDLPSRIPYRSVFAVVDYGTGAYRVATPPGFPILPLVDKEPIVANNGQLKRIVLNRPAAQMLLVRPGVGVWGQVLG